MSEGKKEILLGDCLELMKDIESKSINFVCIDPPYELDNHKGANGYDANVNLGNGHIDFISNGFDIEKVFAEIERICFPLNLVCFCSNKQISKVMGYWENKGYSTTLLIWHKLDPIPLNGGKYVSDAEFMIFVRGLKVTYNNIGVKEQSKIFAFNTASKNNRLHPTQKPLNLIRKLLMIHTKPNDIVLDCFAGSGTTAEACLKENRQFIMIEKEPDYFEKIKKRVGDFNKNFEPQTLFGNEM